MLSTMLETMYTEKEYRYTGRRPIVSDREPQKRGEIPWMIKYEVMVSPTSLRLTFRS